MATAVQETVLPALAELIHGSVEKTGRSGLDRDGKWKESNRSVSKKRFLCCRRMNRRRKCRSRGRLSGGGSSELSVAGGVKFAWVRRA